MCKNQDDENRTFEEKIDDNQTFEEWVDDKIAFWKKFEDFFYNKPWKVILYTFIASLILLIISMLTRISSGAIVIVTYPGTLLPYGLSILGYKKYGIRGPGRGNPLPTIPILWILPFVAFIIHLILRISGAEV